MIIVKQAPHLAQLIATEKTGRQHKIGFVPTMGALHKGHLALVEQSKRETGITVCSIFVNPTQFNNPGDYQKYPNTLEKDIYLLESVGTDILFLPSIAEMYPNGTGNLEQYELGYLETVLEGKYRPGHFQGVCQVMSRLLTMVQPHLLFMGQKDYQQCMVVKRLLTLVNLPVKLITCPTQREPDGLAMSSRNLRLPAGDRQKATAIYQALTLIKQQLPQQSWPAIQQQAHALLTEKGFIVDYIELADAGTLELLTEKKDRPLVALVAAALQEVRLIDNMLLDKLF